MQPVEPSSDYLSLLKTAATIVTNGGGFQEISHSSAVASAVKKFFSARSDSTGSTVATELPDQLQSKRKVYVYDSQQLTFGQKIQRFLTSLFYKYIDVSEYKAALDMVASPSASTQQLQNELTQLKEAYKKTLAELRESVSQKEQELTDLRKENETNRQEIAGLKTSPSTPEMSTAPMPPTGEPKKRAEELQQEIAGMTKTVGSLRTEKATVTLMLEGVTGERNVAADCLVKELKAALHRSLDGLLFIGLKEAPSKPEQKDNVIIFEEKMEDGKPVVQIFNGTDEPITWSPDSVRIQDIVENAKKFTTKYWVLASSTPIN